MGDVIEFRSRKQRAVTRIETAAEDIAAVIASGGCDHRNCTVATRNSVVVWYCNICNRILERQP